MGKLGLTAVAADLMPAGKPAFTSVVQFPAIATLKKHIGSEVVMNAIFLLVKDFCSSLGVVRNMNEDQMIESASMLYQECGSFRLEDYLLMFAMAKRGQLVKIMDRVDITVIAEIVNAYDKKSVDAAYAAQDKSLNPPPYIMPEGAKEADPKEVSAFFSKLSEDLKRRIEDEALKGDSVSEESRRQIMNQRRRAMWEGKLEDDISNPQTEADENGIL